MPDTMTSWLRPAPAAPATPRGKARSGKAGLILDRYVGGVLLRGAALYRKRRDLPRSPKRIGFSVLGAIGDTIVASAIMSDVRRAFPEAHITLIASATNRAIAGLLPVIDEVVTVPVSRPDRAARLIRAARLDLIIDCNQWIRISAIHAALAGVYSIGFQTDGQHRHFAYDHAVPHSRTAHEIENYRALIAPLGIPATALPTVSFEAELPPELEALTASPGMIVFHPWAGGAKGILKEWPDDYWIELGRALERSGHHLVISGGPGDMERSEQLVQAARAAGVTLRSAAGTIKMPQLAQLLTQAAAVVAVNTGIMHLAAAVDAPLVALNGPVSADRWGPLNKNAISLAPKTGGGYLYLGYEHPKGMPTCMTDISPEAALDAVMRVMAAR